MHYDRLCIDNININTEENLNQEKLIVIIDEQKIIDVCDENRTLSNIQENSFSFNPNVLENKNLIDKIKVLEIGHRESCDEEIIIGSVYEDIDLDYETIYPNGPGCPGKCYKADIYLS